MNYIIEMKRIAVIGIILVATGWRFYGFGSRWVLNQDQARDAIIGLYAIRNGQIPEIGSPSSAGPFNFGPWYDFTIMGWQKVLPTVAGPWIGFGILSVLIVVGMMKIGQMIEGKRLAMILGLITAFSVGQVENSGEMLNTVLVATTTTMALVAMVKMIKEKKIWWGVGLGLGAGWSINCHFQSWGLLSLMLTAALINNFDWRGKIKSGLAMGVGFLITFIPIIIFDIGNKGVWIQSVFEYYTVGVKKFYVPVRWLTEIRDFWPRLFGAVTVGVPEAGYVILGLGVVVGLMLIIKKKKIEKFWLALGASLLIQVLLMRFYRGVRSREYLIVFQGYIILITGWVINEIFNKQKLVGVGLMGMMLLASGKNNWELMKRKSQVEEIVIIKQEIDKKAEDKKVIFYNYEQSDMASLPLMYLYYWENKIDEEGMVVGVCDGQRYECPPGDFKSERNYNIYYNSKTEWTKLTPENVYQRLRVNY